MNQEKNANGAGIAKVMKRTAKSMRLIDAEALSKKIAEEAAFKIKKSYRDSARDEARGLIQAREYLKEAPTIPAEIVVHCGLCKNRIYRGGFGGYCPIMGMVHVNDDDFCSYGVKDGAEK